MASTMVVSVSSAQGASSRGRWPQMFSDSWSMTRTFWGGVPTARVTVSVPVAEMELSWVLLTVRLKVWTMALPKPSITGTVADQGSGIP